MSTLLISELASYLTRQGVLTYDETGAAGDTFISVMPTTPDEAVAVFPTGGYQGDVKLGYRLPTVQFMTRSGRDPRPAYRKAEAIYQALHGLSSVQLGAFYIVDCRAMQDGPTHLGQDSNDRHEYSINFELETKEMS